MLNGPITSRMQEKNIHLIFGMFSITIVNKRKWYKDHESSKDILNKILWFDEQNDVCDLQLSAPNTSKPSKHVGICFPMGTNPSSQSPKTLQISLSIYT